MNLIIVFYRCCLGSLTISGLNGVTNPDLCDAGAVLHQLSYQAKLERKSYENLRYLVECRSYQLKLQLYQDFFYE